MIGRVWGLRKLVVERNRFTGWRLVGRKDLHVIHALIVTNNQIPNSSTTDILHLLDTGFVEDGSPLLARLDLKTREHDGTVLARRLTNFLMIGHEIFLQLHEVHGPFNRRENEREGLALLLLLSGIFTYLDKGSNELLRNICLSFDHDEMTFEI